MSSPLVNQFRKGGISRDVRLTAASGALPLTPSDQVELLFLLTRDKDEEIGEMARKAMLAMSVDDLSAVLKDTSLPAEVLTFYGQHTESDDVRQVVVRNQTTPDATIASMVPRLNQVNLEFIVVNQTRLLRHPPIVEVLDGNENLSTDQRRRIDELKVDFKLGEHAVEAKPEPPPPPPKVDLGIGPAEEEEPPPATIEEAEELYGVNEAAADGEEPEEDTRNLLAQLVTMAPAKKMVVALKGARQARMMLIRDKNRAVWSAVLASPKMNEADAEAIAQMKNVTPDVLRELGKKREWTRRYKVAHELVKNPKTPPEVSSQLLARLSSKDLKQLTKDRNVSEVIRRQAKKLSQKSQ